MTSMVQVHAQIIVTSVYPTCKIFRESSDNGSTVGEGADRARRGLRMAYKVAFLALLAVVATPAQERIELEGSVSAIQGARVELFGGLVAFEAGEARIEGEYDGNDLSDISDLRPGADVEVKATVQPDGSILATRIEVSDEREPDNELGGVVATVGESSFTIGPISVEFDDATRLRKLTSVQAGTLVEVALDVSNGRLRASAIEREKPDD